jgi:hypothetical protein
MNEKDLTAENRGPPKKHVWLFHSMAATPWPYMVFLPTVFIFLIAFGWTREDIIEDEVASIWIPTKGSYAKDLDYGAQLGRDDLAISSFAAMAIARDGKNLFTESRLEEIRARMEAAEGTTVTHNGVTYTWQDMCALNSFPYEFPCARLSPMDLFQEARWFFDETSKITWYNEVLQNLLVKPRIPRFGVMTESCASPASDVCDFIVALRTNPTLVGQPAETANPLLLFSDIGNMEMSDPCRICIEENYQSQIEQLFSLAKPVFQVLSAELQRALQVGFANDTEGSAQVGAMLSKTAQLAQSITIEDVKDFYQYFVTRGVYASLGAPAYIAGYQQLLPLIELCNPAFGLTCPSTSVPNTTEAEAALLAHADNSFSPVSTAGAPFPFWSESNGTGNLFAGSNPVSGSGVDMSGEMLSIVGYLDLLNFGQDDWNPLYSNGYLDPVTPDPTWSALVERNPLFNWFMASVTEADPGLVCGNDVLTGTDTPSPEFNAATAGAMAQATSRWCTQYDLPTAEEPEGTFTKQHFARMWYDLLIASDSFLGVTQGEDDPYTWTTGQGCGYNLGGERDPYTGRDEQSILFNASRELYFIDEGETIGVVSRNLLFGDVTPRVGDYSFENPLQEVGLVQSLYASLRPPGIVERVRNCNRPGGAVDITVEDAEDILKLYKEEMENIWSRGWDDDNAGEVQFVGFFDDNGVIGTTGRMLQQITLDNTTLTTISILLIALFSVLFLFSLDWVESRVLITLVGVALVVLSFFAALGFAILIGVKISVTIAWTLPFVILGLGVDDMYIVLLSIKKQGGYREHHYLKAMKEVIVPVTMTSLVNACMFAMMNISDIPAVYLSAQCALYSVILLYLAIITCFPAYCYLDMKRQAAGRKDVFFCLKQENAPSEGKAEDFRNTFLYDKFYKPLVLGSARTRMFTHTLIMLGTVALFGVGIYGITEREVGLGLEDFFPSSNQANTWATTRTEALASWSMGMNWGNIEYTDPDTQMKMIKQFESVVETPHVAEVDTKQLWMANFLIWNSRMCLDNFDRSEFAELECGRDQFHNETQSSCEATWVPNQFGLRQKIIVNPTDEMCYPNEGGICRSGSSMHPADLEDMGILDPDSVRDEVYCPVVSDWTDEKWQFCLTQWRAKTGFSGGRFLLDDPQGSETDCTGVYEKDEALTWPIPFSSGPTMYSFDMFSHEETLVMMDETRTFCDDDPDLQCWLTGIAFDYWTQVLTNLDWLLSHCTGW